MPTAQKFVSLISFLFLLPIFLPYLSLAGTAQLSFSDRRSRSKGKRWTNPKARVCKVRPKLPDPERPVQSNVTVKLKLPCSVLITLPVREQCIGWWVTS